MGFWDSLQNGFDAKQEELERERSSSFQTIVQQRENAYRAGFFQMNDGTLLGKYNSPHTSDKDKRIIEEVLKSRGYRRNERGIFDRR